MNMATTKSLTGGPELSSGYGYVIPTTVDGVKLRTGLIWINGPISWESIAIMARYG